MVGDFDPNATVFHTRPTRYVLIILLCISTKNFKPVDRRIASMSGREEVSMWECTIRLGNIFDQISASFIVPFPFSLILEFSRAVQPVVSGTFKLLLALPYANASTLNNYSRIYLIIFANPLPS